MTSSNSGGEPARRQAIAADGAELSPLDDFLADVVDLALSVDRELADIISDSAAPATPRLPWRGGRLQGLELCLSMLRYAREEAMDANLGRRLDEAITHAAAEIETARRAQKPLR